MRTKDFNETIKKYGSRAPKIFESFEINKVAKLTPAQKKIVKRMEDKNEKERNVI